MPEVLILSSSALTDRILVHTDLLAELSEHANTRIWATSAANPRFSNSWRSVPAEVEAFPATRPYPELRVNMIRRMNDLSWDYSFRDPSRLSMMRHLREKNQIWYVRMLKHPARLIAALGLQPRLEAHVERLMIDFERSSDAIARLRTLRPAAVLSMGPLLFEEPAAVGAAKKLGIPVLAFITSWDNLSIKHRLVFRYDGYIVWSERMKQELQERYPEAKRAPVYITGAPQFDIFFREELFLSREEFCHRHGLEPDLPIVVNALGVANCVEEHHGAIDLANRVVRGELGEVQLIVRPHPFLNGLELREMFRRFGPRVVVQQSGDPGEKRTLRSQDMEGVVEWVNTFRHANVVVHLSSTVGIDAAIFDRPSVCLDYDPTPGSPRQELVREVNHRWTHYKPVAESGGMWLASSQEEVVEAIRSYLRNPALHRESRRAMAAHVCGYLDGLSSSRMACAVIEHLNKLPGRSTSLCELART